jgi:hypothetical protein
MKKNTPELQSDAAVSIVYRIIYIQPGVCFLSMGLGDGIENMSQRAGYRFKKLQTMGDYLITYLLPYIYMYVSLNLTPCFSVNKLRKINVCLRHHNQHVQCRYRNTCNGYPMISTGQKDKYRTLHVL